MRADLKWADVQDRIQQVLSGRGRGGGDDSFDRGSGRDCAPNEGTHGNRGTDAAEQVVPIALIHIV
jgi:hypothetical protein